MGQHTIRIDPPDLHDNPTVATTALSHTSRSPLNDETRALGLARLAASLSNGIIQRTPRVSTLKPIIQ